MIQIHVTLTISLSITCILIATFLTLVFMKKQDYDLYYLYLLIIGVMALLSLAQTLELIMI